MAKFIVVSAFVAAAIAITSAASVAEKDAVKALVVPIMEGCGKEFGVSKEDFVAAKASKDINAIDSCVYACFYKKTNILDDGGNFNVAFAKENGSKLLSDPEDLKKLADVADKCAAVNDESVSDGAKGCERAKLLTACLIKDLHGYKSMLID